MGHTKIISTKRSKTPKIVRGRTGGSNRFKGVPPPTRDYFIYRVVKPTEEPIKDNEITCATVEMLSNPEAKYCSFKISVSINEVDKLLTTDIICPEGVRVRRCLIILTLTMGNKIIENPLQSKISYSCNVFSGKLNFTGKLFEPSDFLMLQEHGLYKC